MRLCRNKLHDLSKPGTLARNQCRACKNAASKASRKKLYTYERGRRGHLRKAYGITLEAYEEMVLRQDGACAICQEPTMDTPFIDHDHKTGAVREILCSACNCGLGFFKDSAALLRLAIRYLGKHKQTGCSATPPSAAPASLLNSVRRSK